MLFRSLAYCCASGATSPTIAHNYASGEIDTPYYASDATGASCPVFGLSLSARDQLSGGTARSPACGGHLAGHRAYVTPTPTSDASSPLVGSAFIGRLTYTVHPPRRIHPSRRPVCACSRFPFLCCFTSWDRSIDGHPSQANTYVTRQGHVRLRCLPPLHGKSYYLGSSVKYSSSTLVPTVVVGLDK